MRPHLGCLQLSQDGKLAMIAALSRGLECTVQVMFALRNHAWCTLCRCSGLCIYCHVTICMMAAHSVVQHATAVDRRVVILQREQSQILEDGMKVGVPLVIGEQPSAQKSASAFDDYMEYARSISELAAMDSMASSSGPQFAALNGALGRDLIARLQSNESRDKLVRKLERLEKKLRISQRWSAESADFEVSNWMW